MTLNYSYQSKPVDEDKTKLFTRLMVEGKVKVALRILEGENSIRQFPLDQLLFDWDETDLDVLKFKRPSPHKNVRTCL